MIPAEQYLLCYAYLIKVILNLACCRLKFYSVVFMIIFVVSLDAEWQQSYKLLANPFPPPPVLSQIKCQNNKSVVKIFDTLICVYAKYLTR